MDSQWKFLPSRSAIVHMRFGFSFFLLPVFLFALSQAPVVNTINAVLTFITWHFFVYPASNGYNSYFDKDQGSIALIEKPPIVDRSLYYFSLLLDVAGLIIAAFVNWGLFTAVLIYGLFSKLYSHPSIRLKRFPVLSFLIVFIFQGACVYWSSYAAISDLEISAGWNINFFVAGLICSFLIGATYPLTQVYQHDEDRNRGDTTLSIVLGINGSFYFSALFFLASIVLLWFYWYNMGTLKNFWLFLALMIPVITVFCRWLLKVHRDPAEANFKNMSRMTLFSGGMMVIYFGILNFI